MSLRFNIQSMALKAVKGARSVLGYPFRDSAIRRGKKLRDEGRWRELLDLCRAKGLTKPQFALFRMTAACALQDTDEIAKLIGRLREMETGSVLFRRQDLMTTLALILERSNYAPQAAEMLLLSHEKLTWSAADVSKAARLSRLVMARHARLSAELLLAVAGRVGLQEDEIVRAEKLARTLLQEAPEKTAELLLAIYRQTGWTELQAADASHLLDLLTSTPLTEALRTALHENKPSAEEENSQKITVSPFKFPSVNDGRGHLGAAKEFSFQVYRNEAGLVSCEKRFRDFQTEFLRALPVRKPPLVTLLKNAYVNHLGQIWTGDGAIISKLGRKIPNLQPKQAQKIESGTSLIASTSGIYHWLVDLLPSISWTSQPEAAGIQILIPAELPAYKADSLAFAGLAAGKLVPLREEACFFEKLYLTRGSNYNLLFAREFLRQFVQRALARATQREANKVYVSRKDATRRTMQNEAELEEALAARGFVITVLTGMPLADQIALFARASLIVGPHGGGMTHLMFARPGTRVVELVPASEQMSDSAIHLRFNYARISMIKGLKYHLCLEESHLTLGTWTAKLEPLLRLIDSLD